MQEYKKRARKGYDSTSKKTNLRERRERAYGRREVWEALNKPDTSAYYSRPKYSTHVGSQPVSVAQNEPWWKGL